MSGDLRYNSGAYRRVRGRGGASRLLDAVMLIVTVVFAVLLVLSYMARHVHPQVSWVFAFAGLTAPILYVVNIALLLFWVLRWRLFVVIPAVVLLIGAGSLTLFFKPTLSKHYGSEEPGAMVVMTYNVMGFLDRDEQTGKLFPTVDTVSAFIRSFSPDVLCIQEFQATSSEQKALIDSLIGMPHSKINYVIPNRRGGGWGLAVYSRFPIIASDVIDYPGSNNSSLWVDIRKGDDTLRVFNNHFQTTSVDGSDREYIQNHEYMQDSQEREERVRGIASKLRRNYIIRAMQADSIAPVIRDTPYRVFVCGDFNDTPMSYVYHKVRGELKDTFVEKGSGVNSNTFRGLFNLFRIDYILHSREVKALYYLSPDNEYSDHKAVIGHYIW